MPHLRMDATYGKIGLSIKDARQTIHQQRADLTIRQPEAEMSIHTVPGQLDIDQSQAFAEANLKSIFQVTRDYARHGRQVVLQGIARRAQQGDALMKIENGGKPIAGQARINSTDPRHEINIGWMPRSAFSVKFHYRPAEVNIRTQTQAPVIHAQPHRPEYTYTRGDVSSYMRQESSLEINVTGLGYDQQI